MSKLRYVPAISSPGEIYLKYFAETYQAFDRPYMTNIKSAEAWLNDRTRGLEHPAMGIGIGNNEQSVHPGYISSIFTVEPSDGLEKHLDTYKKSIFGLGEYADAPLRGHEILNAEHTFLPDYLHPQPVTISEKVPFGADAPSNEKLLEMAARRIWASQLLQNSITFAPQNERTEIDLDDPKTKRSFQEAFAVDGFAQGSSEGMDFASKVFQKVEREMAGDLNEIIETVDRNENPNELLKKTMTATTLSQLGDIHATFNAKLEALTSSPMSDREKVSLAMTQTIEAFREKVPSVDVQKMDDLQNRIEGIIDEVAHEAELDDRDPSELDVDLDEPQIGGLDD